MGTKKALIIVSTKHHEGFTKVLPRADDSAIAETFAEPLKTILNDPESAGFSEVTLLVDKKCDELIKCIGQFFSPSSGDGDLLFFYFYGYGIADNDHTLHLLAGDSSPMCFDDGSFASLERCVDISKLVLKQVAKSPKATKVIFLDVLWGTTINEDDLKAGNAEEDRNHCLEMLNRIPKLSLIVAHEVFLANYYTLMHWRELQRSEFSPIILRGLKEFLADSDGDSRITVDELYGHVVNQLRQSGSDLKPWKWDPGIAIGPTELVRVPERVASSAKTRDRRIDAGAGKASFKLESCFVISPLKGERAQWVLERAIVPGCLRAGYRAARSDHLLKPEIMPTVIQELREAPMTVAYLGPSISGDHDTTPQWSPNVMIEVGFRLAMGKPIVLLREEPDEKEEPLPFDIKDRRTIYLPKSGEGQDLEKTIENIADYIRALKETEVTGSLWNSDHPFAQLSFKIGENNGTFLDSSPAADSLFAKAGIECGLRSIDLASFIRNICDAMPLSQGDAFLAEQRQLIGQLVAPFWKVARNEMPVATVPIIFAEQTSRRAYLPIIVERSQQGDVMFLKILYLDVSGKVTERGGRGKSKIYVCDLRGEEVNDSAMAATG